MLLHGHDRVAAHCSYAVLVLRFARSRSSEEREAIRTGLVDAGVIEADRAMEQVKGAIASEYDHLDALETDADLGELLVDPEFVAASAAWREQAALSEPVREVGSEDFDELVLQSDRPVLVDFAADWCGPCEMQARVLEKFARLARGDYRVMTLDVDASPEIAEAYEVRSLPTLIVFSRGEIRAQRTGVTPIAELRRLVADG